MPPEILATPTNDNRPDGIDQSPDLPSLGERWTTRRKAAVIEAVRGAGRGVPAL